MVEGGLYDISRVLWKGSRADVTNNVREFSLSKTKTLIVTLENDCHSKAFGFVVLCSRINDMLLIH